MAQRTESGVLERYLYKQVCIHNSQEVEVNPGVSPLTSGYIKMEYYSTTVQRKGTRTPAMARMNLEHITGSEISQSQKMPNDGTCLLSLESKFTDGG